MTEAWLIAMRLNVHISGVKESSVCVKDVDR